LSANAKLVRDDELENTQLHMPGQDYRRMHPPPMVKLWVQTLLVLEGNSPFLDYSRLKEELQQLLTKKATGGFDSLIGRVASNAFALSKSLSRRSGKRKTTKRAVI
jgi:hypothetical protein